ncbi:uncharacterized protein UHOD_12079 [Ustilago sp. UG-2017b]|nr:uncharacterized protein UHOD_12079 [Ustilago sp. UG-2017b]
MVSRHTRIVSLLLLLAIHAVGVLSAWGFGSPGRGEWPEGQILTDKGYVAAIGPEGARNTFLGQAAMNKAVALYRHGITYTSIDNKVKLHEDEFGEALEIAKKDGGGYVGHDRQKDHYFYSIIKPDTKLGQRLGLRPWHRMPFFGSKRYASVLWKHTNGKDFSIVAVTKFKTDYKIDWKLKPFEEVLEHMPK